MVVCKQIFSIPYDGIVQEMLIQLDLEEWSEKSKSKWFENTIHRIKFNENLLEALSVEQIERIQIFRAKNPSILKLLCAEMKVSVIKI